MSAVVPTGRPLSPIVNLRVCAPVAAEVEIDEVGEGAPSAVVRLERAHDGEFQVLEDVEVERRAAESAGTLVLPLTEGT